MYVNGIMIYFVCNGYEDIPCISGVKLHFGCQWYNEYLNVRQGYNDILCMSVGHTLYVRGIMAYFV